MDDTDSKRTNTRGRSAAEKSNAISNRSLSGSRKPGVQPVNRRADSDTEISQESSNNISQEEWLISVENNVDDKIVKPQIQRIPSLLREKQSNNNCYDPLVVSIGPYHHEKRQLDAFEKLKIPIAQKFWRACENKVSIEQIYEAVAMEGNSAREYYEEGSTNESFNKMMFLDACFVLHFMSSFYSNGTDMKQKVNPLGPLLPWSRYLTFVGRDLFLLENQIPLQVLKVLMKFRFKNEREGTMLIQNFLDRMAIMPPQERTRTNAVKKVVQRMMGCSVQKKEEWKINMGAFPPHLLHLVREQLIGSSPKDKNEKKSVKRLLHLVRKLLIGSSTDYKNEKKWYSYRSVTELKSAGIHFRPSQTNHVTDVKFKSHLISGTLTLPRIVVDDTTKPLLLNLAAYEMCPDGPSDNRIMSYICLMDSLIDHADDVKELRRRRILVNNLGSDEELAQLFNEIANGLVFDPEAYADVKLQIQNHCERKAKVWMAEWIHDHFSSPWAFLAFLGAIFVIALTMVQAYFAAFPH